LVTAQKLQACAAGDDPVNVSVAVQIVLQAERVPYTVGKVEKAIR
jgi:hypothetical protein